MNKIRTADANNMGNTGSALDHGKHARQNTRAPHAKLRSPLAEQIVSKRADSFTCHAQCLVLRISKPRIEHLSKLLQQVTAGASTNQRLPQQQLWDSIETISQKNITQRQNATNFRTHQLHPCCELHPTVPHQCLRKF